MIFLLSSLLQEIHFHGNTSLSSLLKKVLCGFFYYTFFAQVYL